MKHVLGAVVAVSFAFAAQAELEAEPYTCHWTGEVNSNFWDPGNWREGKVPGVWTSSGVDAEGNAIVVTNGCRGCTAVFGRVPNSKLDQRRLIKANQYTLNPNAANMMLSIGNIVFDATPVEGHPEYVEVEYLVNYSIGWTWGEPYLPLEGGSKIEMAADRTKNVLFESTLCLGSLEPKGQTYTFANWSEDAYLSIRRLSDGAGTDANNVSPSGRWGKGVTGWFTHYLRMEGAGEIRILGTVERSGEEYIPQLAMTGGKLVYPNGATLFQLSVPSGCGEQVLEIPEGKVVQLDCSNSSIANIFSDLRITGDGTFKVQSGSGANRQFGLGSDATVTVECALGNRQTSGTYCGELPGLWLTGKGSFRQTGENQIQGAVELYEKAEYIAPVVGMVGSSDGIGAGQKIRLGTGARLRYTGNGEYTDKQISLSGGGGTVIQAGMGALVFSNVVGDWGDYVLVVSNETEAAVGFAGTVGCNLTLQPTSRVKFAVPDGEDSASITVNYLTFADGASAEVDDGVTVTINQFLPQDGAVLDVTAGEYATVMLPNVAAGFVGSLRLNGERARVDELGIVKPLSTDDYEIAARDDVVPNLSSATVAITSPGSEEGGKDTLEDNAVEVLVLRNRLTETTPVVELGEGQTLTAAFFETLGDATPILFSGEGAISGAFTLDGTIGRVNEADGVSYTVSAEGAKLSLGGAASTAHPMSAALESGKVTLETIGTLPATGNIAVGSKAGPVLEITGAETVISGKVFVAQYASQFGAVYQTDGTFFSRGNGDTFVAQQGYGYWLLEGGFITNAVGSAYVGYYGLAVFEQTGGLWNQAAGCADVRGVDGAVAVMHQSGGEIRQAANGYDLYLETKSGARGVWTIDGEGTLAEARTRNFVLGANDGSTADATAVLNLNNGGKLQVGAVVSPKGHNSAHHTYLNFNGGVLFNNYLYGNIFGKTGTQYFDQLDKVTLFEKGATLQISADCTQNVPMSAPTKKGVASVPWTDESSVFIGPPAVMIEGDGAGATAFAHFDRATGKVTSIEVTSPGWDYTEAEAVFYYGTTSGMKPIEIARVACVLTDNVSGGFTKTGGSQLTISAVNTYEGPTVIKAGTLLLGADGGFSPKSALVLDGGTFNLNNHAATFADISCNGGKVTNGKVTVTGLTVDFDAALAGTAKKVDAAYCELTDDAPVALAGYAAEKLAGVKKVALVSFSNGTPTALDCSATELPENWSFVLKNDKLTLKKTLPTVLLVR